MNQMNNPK